MSFQEYLHKTKLAMQEPRLYKQAYGVVDIECCNYRDTYNVEPHLIITLLNKIPSAHIDGINHIQYAPLLFNSVKEKNKSYIRSGLYYRKEKCIILGGVSSSAQLKKILYHEIGHHLQIKGNCNFQNMQWIAISRESEKYVSRYARTDYEEDFAESYAEYLISPVHLKSLSLPKFNFIKYLFNSHASLNEEGWIG